MYHGKFSYYKNTVQERLGKYELKKPTVYFYMWFYGVVRPSCYYGRSQNDQLARFDTRYAYDLPRLRDKSITVEGALASLCDLRNMNSPDAWRFYYSLYENKVIRPNTGLYLADYQPSGCRFSLRLAKVDPVFFQFHGQHGPPKTGCRQCHHLLVGCGSCFKNNQLTYKQAARKNLQTRLIYHSKCCGNGCCLCYNKAREMVRARNLTSGVYLAVSNPHQDHFHK
jgi:hypothetical protein